ncbi:MAG TPA: aminoglycoside phosphotransferase family protein [Clostridia bacterium]|nr:aminoglycoside phosphotransferase family protein [Clostridia bacterium]
MQTIAESFGLSEVISHYNEVNSGNINRTYHATLANGEEYTLQLINHHVFRDPDAIMSNIAHVTTHLERKFALEGRNPKRHVLHFLRTLEGRLIHRDAEGCYWRCYAYINGATAHDTVSKPEHFYQAGRAFGEFQRHLCDFPMDTLYETIPGFHDTPRRFEAFEAAVAADRVGRAASVSREIEFFRERKAMMGRIVSLIETDELPLRVTHNDTKINNVLIDDKSDEAICVIDLDTVMPGSVLYDYGDAIRFGANRAAEDEPDLSKISLDMELFAQFTRGFLSMVDGFLTQEEILMLPLGVQVITCELAMRFLTDYLDGDRYFRVRDAEHNLVRARAQMRLLEDVEEKSLEMKRIIDEEIAHPNRGGERYASAAQSS